MDSDDADVLCAIAVTAFLNNEFGKKVKKRKKRNEWTKRWLQRRSEKGLYNNLVKELRLEEVAIYTNYLRMKPDCFDFLLSLVKGDLAKQNTVMRDAISPEIKLVHFYCMYVMKKLL